MAKEAVQIFGKEMNIIKQKENATWQPLQDARGFNRIWRQSPKMEARLDIIFLAEIAKSQTHG